MCTVVINLKLAACLYMLSSQVSDHVFNFGTSCHYSRRPRAPFTPTTLDPESLPSSSNKWRPLQPRHKQNSRPTECLYNGAMVALRECNIIPGNVRYSCSVDSINWPLRRSLLTADGNVHATLFAWTTLPLGYAIWNFWLWCHIGSTNNSLVHHLRDCTLLCDLGR